MITHPESGQVEASVVIPTAGRPELLRACLESLSACEPRAAEVVVVDQSRGEEVAAVVGEFAAFGVRTIPDPGRGRGRAVNRGLHGARHDLLLVTDDDCTVSRDWVARAEKAHREAPHGLITGRVLPVGDPLAVPSTIDVEEPIDYTGTMASKVLYGGNMVGSRTELLEFGGFDEDILPSAEDNELCLRWLKAGRTLRHDPDIVVWHHAWRTHEEMVALYRAYSYGNGVYYAKHLRRGDIRVLRDIASDLRAAIRGEVAALVRSERRWWDWRLGILPALPRGIIEGMRRNGRRAVTRRP